jgi:hypothetical protein
LAYFQASGNAPGPRTEWLGREGSNLRMPESKSGALPLGDAPAGRLGIDQPGRGANPAKWPEGRHFCPVAGGRGHRYKGASRGEGPSFRTWLRRVAQPGRALRSGRRGRRFESSLSDHLLQQLSAYFHIMRDVVVRIQCENSPTSTPFAWSCSTNCFLVFR